MPQILTEVAIRNLQAKPRAYKVFDRNGLYLEIYPTGSKLWRFRWMRDGKDSRRSLGPWPEVSLRRARELALERKAALRDGDARPGRPAGAPMRLADLAGEWSRRFFPSLASSTVKKTKLSLTAHILPKLGSMPLAELTPGAMLVSLLRPIEAAGHLETAHRARSLLSRIFRYAVSSGYMERDSAQGLRGALPPPVDKHRATITDPAKIGLLMRDIHHYGGSPGTTAALRILPYVFVRPGELRNAVWEEFDFEGSICRIPAERMKMRAPHLVPLSRQVKALLLELRERSCGEGLVFKGARRKTIPISDVTINAALRYLGYGKDEICGHGFRAMASTILNEKGYNRDWIERQLAHSERSGVRAAYNHAEWLQERRQMMQDWADYLDSLWR